MGFGFGVCRGLGPFGTSFGALGFTVCSPGCKSQVEEGFWGFSGSD